MKSRSVRRIVFFVFILVFAIGAPASVLYTAGFRYDFSSSSLVRTGSLFVQSIPRNADISLNGERIQKKTPFTFKHLVPGTYDIELTKDDHHSWTSSLEIKSSETTYADDVLLFTNAQTAPSPHANVRSASPSPQGSFFVAIEEHEGWREIWLTSNADMSRVMVGRHLSHLQATDIVWSADGRHFGHISNGSAYAWDRDGAQTAFIDDTSYDSFSWHPFASETFLLTSAEHTLGFDASGNTVDLSMDGSIDLDASSLLFVDADIYTELRMTTGEKTEVIALLPRGEYTFSERDESYLILTNTLHQLYLLDLDSAQPILLETRAIDFDWDPRLHRLAYTDGLELNVYDANSHHTEFLTRQSAPITATSWHPSGFAVLYGTATNVRAMLYNRHGASRQVTQLLDANIDQFWLSEDGQYLMTLNINDTIYRQQIAQNGLLQLITLK